MPTSHSPQVREAGEANNDDGEEDPDARRAPPAIAAAEVAAADDAEPMLDVPRGMARPLSVSP